MSESELFVRFATVSAVALGAVVSGVGFVLFAPKGWVGRLAIGAAGVLAAAGGALLVAPELAGWAGGIAAGVAAVLLPLGSRSVRRFLAWAGKCLTNPRVAGGAVLAAAGVWWGYEAYRYETAQAQMMDATMQGVTDVTPPPTAPADTPAVTDRGTPIALATAVDPLTPAEAQRQETSCGVLSARAAALIRRGPAADESNCHGWVFAGGRYNLPGREVPTILAENGYTEVGVPAAGDVCVYRGSGGDVTHSAVVAAVLHDGTVLVEGKWGRMGVFLHTADASAYGTDYTFYHSPRGTHLLRGLDPDTATGTSAASSHP